MARPTAGHQRPTTAGERPATTTTGQRPEARGQGLSQWQSVLSPRPGWSHLQAMLANITGNAQCLNPAAYRSHHRMLQMTVATFSWTTYAVEERPAMITTNSLLPTFNRVLAFDRELDRLMNGKRF